MKFKPNSHSLFSRRGIRNKVAAIKSFWLFMELRKSFALPVFGEKKVPKSEFDRTSTTQYSKKIRSFPPKVNRLFP